MRTYLDTSYLVALYVPNDHSEAALRYRGREHELPMHFSPLHRLELRTTVRQCVFAGVIKETEGRRILRHIEEDLDDGTLLHEPLDWLESLKRAEAVAQRRAWKMSCRSLDLWHVAAALESEAGLFVTFDQDQSELAKTEGLRVLIPR